MPVVSLGLLASGCGDDAIIVNDEGVSSGGVKLDVLEPERGSILGGQNVLLQGKGLGGNNVVVAFGDMVADNVVVLSSEALLVVTPPGLAPGPTDVFVANAQGFAQRNAGFTYNDPPSVASVSPDSGARVGGEEVTISGTGFQDNDAGTPQVFFDGEPAPDVTVVSDTEITATTPPGMPLVRADVQVRNINGVGEAPEAYLYVANGLFASNPDPTGCRGSNNHSQTPAALMFVDLDDNTTLDLGLQDTLGFTKLSPDGQGGLIGLQACSGNIFQIDPQTSETTLLVQTTMPPGRRHAAGIAPLGNDFIIRGPESGTQFARVSGATGEVTPIGQAGVNPDTSSRGAILFENGQMFFVGRVLIAQANVNGIAEFDPATGAQIAEVTAVNGNFTIQTAALHRDELFVIRRTSLGKGGNSASNLVRVDRETGTVSFDVFIPSYVNGLASGDL